MAASLRGGRDFFCTNAASYPASHLHPGGNHSHEVHDFQCNDHSRLGYLVRRAGLVWTDGDHARDVAGSGGDGPGIESEIASDRRRCAGVVRSVFCRDAADDRRAADALSTAQGTTAAPAVVPWWRLT